MRFTGFCVYSISGSVWLALLLSTSAALVATCYSVASCRLFVIDFVSDTGSFEEHFNRLSTIDNINVSYKASVGLFQWLRPSSENIWNRGSCIGYQETMRSVLSDTYFDMGRIFGVLATILGSFQVVWVFMLSCLAMTNPFQAWLLCGLCLVTSAMTCLTFLFSKSSLCQTLFVERTCSLDEGGLFMIAGAVLWLVSFCLVFWFVLPQVLPDHKERTTNNNRRVSPNNRSIPSGWSIDSRLSWMSPVFRSNNNNKKSKQKIRPVVMDDSDPNATEVYIKQRLDRIDGLASV